LHDKALDIFEAIICTRWNAQNKYFQKNRIDHMVDLFGDLFNKFEITSRANTYLKYVKDQYRVQLKKNPKYNCHMAIVEMEGKSVQEGARESALRNKGKAPPGPRRQYMIF
jgi:hypothetical protein